MGGLHGRAGVTSIIIQAYLQRGIVDVTLRIMAKGTRTRGLNIYTFYLNIRSRSKLSARQQRVVLDDIRENPVIRALAGISYNFGEMCYFFLHPVQQYVRHYVCNCVRSRTNPPGLHPSQP